MGCDAGAEAAAEDDDAPRVDVVAPRDRIVERQSVGREHRFAVVADAKRDAMPLLAIVGTADSIIPIERSRALYDAWAGPKTWLAIAGADHNDLGATDELWQGVAVFLAQR